MPNTTSPATSLPVTQLNPTLPVNPNFVTFKPPTTNPTQSNSDNLDSVDIDEFKPLAYSFEPSDFYYYNAQNPLGINFLESVFNNGINYSDPSYVNFDVSNQYQNPNSSYSIPYQILQDKCANPDKLIQDISSSLYTYLSNEPLNKSGNFGNDLINSSPSSISIVDNYGIKHTYFPNQSNDPNNYININQNPEDHTFYGDVSINYINGDNNSNDPNNNYKLLTGDNYTGFSSLIKDSGGNKFVTDNSNNFTNGCLYIYNSSNGGKYYDISNTNCIGNTHDLTKFNDSDNNIDLFMNNLSSMSFDLFPDYSSVNSYINPEETNKTYNPHIESLINLIANYYINLCKNKQKAEKYQNLVTNTNSSGSNDLYNDSIDNYYREYTRIFNISAGLIVTIGIIYNLSK